MTEKPAKTRKLWIGLDFDGTCCTHRFPAIGEDIGAVPVLLELASHGHKIALNTMRSGEYLTEAVEWLRARGVPVHAVYHRPGQRRWTTSPKCHADLFIDDAALGCPQLPDTSVDWDGVRKLLVKAGVLPQKKAVAK